MRVLPGIFLVALLLLNAVGGARTYIVDDDGFANYKTIQEAVIAATDGDTIYIKPGVYSEEVVLNRSLTLMPLSGEVDPILITGDGRGKGVTITSDGCSLEGLTIQNFTGPGIEVLSDGNRIVRCTFSGDDPAVLISGSRQNTVSRNRMQDCQGGVALKDNSSDNSVTSNEIEGGVVGVLIRDSQKNSIAGNSVARSSIGVWLMNSSRTEVSGNSISAETYGIWAFNSSQGSIADGSVTGSTRGIYLMNVTRLSVHNISIEDGEFGIILENSSRNIISGCSLENCSRAIGMGMSSGNILSGNRMENIDDTAVEMDYSGGNRLVGNEISVSDKGLIILDSPYNSMESNRLNAVRWGLYVESATEEGFNNSIDGSNLVDGAPIAYLYGRSGEQIQERTLAHITLAYCDNITVERSEITNDALFLFSSRDNRILENNISYCFGMRLLNSASNEISENRLIGNRYSGLFMVSSDSNTIQRNIAAENNQNGISLLGCSGNTVRDNRVEDNYEAGVWLNLSNDNIICLNNITRNPVGLQIMYSAGNRIYHNNFLENKEHSEDIAGNNSWDMGNVTGGNYWSGHVAKGNPSHDWPRAIKGGSIDRYPFQDPGGWLISGLKE